MTQDASANRSTPAHEQANQIAFGKVAGSEPVDILIVDDQPEVLAVLKRQMQRKGYSVRTAGDACEAAEALSLCRPRVILLDLMMPRIDGATFLRNLREENSPGALPVIVVTASNQREDMLRCLDAGANDFVLKPVDLDALAARVELQVAIADRFRALESSDEISSKASCAREALWEWRPDLNTFGASATFPGVWGSERRPKSLEEWVAGWRLEDADAFLDKIAQLRLNPASQFELHVRKGADAERAFIVRAGLDKDGDRVMGAIVDISEPYLRDSASKLPAFGAFADRLAARHERGKSSTVLTFEVGRFDELTLAHGIARGDDAIWVYISTVRRAAAPIGELFRLGPTEFAVLAEDSASVGAVRALAKDLAEGGKFGVQIGEDQVHRVSSSVGVVLQSVEPPDEVRFRARLALKAASEAGLGRVCEYSDELRDLRLRLARMESRLSVALERATIGVAFQPVADVESGRWLGIEAIAQWRDAELGAVPAQELAACADLIGQPLRLVEVLAHRAFAIGREINEIVPKPMFVAVNMTAAAIRDQRLATLLIKVAREEQFDLANLVVEISEDDILSSYESCVEAFGKLNNLGARVAIDDFGSSYSCLAYLCRAPCQILKLDKSVLDAARERPDARTLLGTTARMAQHLGKIVVLNGVDDPSEIQIAREVGASMVQGGFTAAPLTDRDLVETIRALA
jgi:EAL domain-containing protein (putative c-di-GMP-specific phosphodiesterase class I)/PleD family two-component response regulator